MPAIHHTLQALAQILSQPAWQGVGSFASLISIFLSLIPSKAPRTRNMIKKTFGDNNLSKCYLILYKICISTLSSYKRV